MSIFYKLFATFLILVYLVVINGNLISLLEYYIRYDYIIKNLCVQREKDENTCKGSCHLEENLNKINPESPKSAESIEIRFLNGIDFHLNNTTSYTKPIGFKIKYTRLLDFSFRNNLKLKPDTPPPKNLSLL